MQAIDANGLAPAATRFRGAQHARTVPTVVRVGHQPALKVTAAHDGSERPVGEVQRDHLGWLICGTVSELRREGLRVGALVGRPSLAARANPGPESDRLRSVTDAPVPVQLFEMGAYRPVRHSELLG